MNLTPFDHLELLGGFLILHVEVSDEPLIDAIGGEALARTTIIGREFEITLCPGLSGKELSVMLYHEVLEAAAVAADDPPESLSSLTKATSRQPPTPRMTSLAHYHPRHARNATALQAGDTQERGFPNPRRVDGSRARLSPFDVFQPSRGDRKPTSHGS